MKKQAQQVFKLSVRLSEIHKITATGSEIAIHTEEKSKEGLHRLKLLEESMNKAHNNMEQISKEMEQLIFYL